ncbi:MAG: DEAD/DEAH box helicase [Candidatus Melainabacteria bacterium]|nr:DEAD/DEAH box helicase [Candidatus Melainabacteria bacterium]
MLKRGVRPSTPAVVTSGTGSGKTEAFLLPLLASLTKEASTWSKPDQGYLSARWWHDENGRPYSRVDRNGQTRVSFSAIPQRLRPLTNTPLNSPFRRHREGERRTAAVRAILLYPMNALVEDQLVRLRKALDSREAREAMDRHFNGNRIFFGRYIGNTPVTNHHIHPGFQPLLDAPRDNLSGSIRFAAGYDLEDHDTEEDALQAVREPSSREGREA